MRRMRCLLLLPLVLLDAATAFAPPSLHSDCHPSRCRSYYRSSAAGSSSSAEEPPLPPPSLAGRRAYFVNLSNGCEACGALAAAGVPWAAVRIQSSHLEGKHYAELLDGLDANFLVHLAAGAECVVLDFGANRKQWPDGVPPGVPRALWQGLAFIRFAVHDAWGLPPPPKETLRLRGHDGTEHFESALRALPQRTRRRLRYFRDFLPPQHLPSPPSSSSPPSLASSLASSPLPSSSSSSSSLSSSSSSSLSCTPPPPPPPPPPPFSVRLRSAYRLTALDKQKATHVAAFRAAALTNPALVASSSSSSSSSYSPAVTAVECGDGSGCGCGDLWLPDGMVEYDPAAFTAAGRGKVARSSSSS